MLTCVMFILFGNCMKDFVLYNTGSVVVFTVVFLCFNVLVETIYDIQNANGLDNIVGCGQQHEPLLCYDTKRDPQATRQQLQKKHSSICSDDNRSL